MHCPSATCVLQVCCKAFKRYWKNSIAVNKSSKTEVKIATSLDQSTTVINRKTICTSVYFAVYCIILLVTVYLWLYLACTADLFYCISIIVLIYVPIVMRMYCLLNLVDGDFLVLGRNSPVDRRHVCPSWREIGHVTGWSHMGKFMISHVSVL